MDIPSASEKIASSAPIAALARIAIIIATLILPIFAGGLGWAINRGVTAIDGMTNQVTTIKDQQAETNTTLRLIQQTLQIQGTVVTDHEARMRLLESLTRGNR